MPAPTIKESRLAETMSEPDAAADYRCPQSQPPTQEEEDEIAPSCRALISSPQTTKKRDRRTNESSDADLRHFVANRTTGKEQPGKIRARDCGHAAHHSASKANKNARTSAAATSV